MTRCCIALIAVLAATDVRVSAVELIENGSFEADGYTTGRLLTGWDHGRGRGFNVFEYPYGNCGDHWCGGTEAFDSPGPPTGGVSGPVARGNLYAFAFSSGVVVGGGVQWQGFAAQHIDVARYAGRRFDFSAWIASSSRPDDGDYATLSLTFFENANALGGVLGSLMFDGSDLQSPFIIGSADAQGIADSAVPATQDNWSFYMSAGRIPAQAVSAAIVIRGDSNSITGGVNDGYVDLVSLQVVPEPSTFILAAVLLSLAGWWAGARRGERGR